MKNNNLDKFGLVKVKNPNGQFLKSVFLGLCMLILSFSGFSFATMMPKSHANAADDSNSASWAVSVFKGSTFDKGFYNINDAWNYMTSNYGSAYTLQINTSQELTKGLVWSDTSASGSLKVTTGFNSVVLAKSASFSGGGSMNMDYAMITVTAGTFEMAPESTDLSITLLGNTEANAMFGRYIINLRGAKSAKFKRVFVSGNYDRAVNITSSNTDAIFEDVTFQGNNTASNQISTMYIESKATFTNCKFINNTTYNSVVYMNGGTVTMDTCSFVNNTSSNYGGAITLYSGTLTVSNSEFANNSTSSTNSPYGGAIYVRNGALNLSSTNFLYNTASSGGAIYQYGGTISPITGCTFEGNSASGYGGAISYNTTQTIVRKISNCTFTANYAGTRGGAIDDIVTSNTQQLDITSTTFTKNESRDGSAIANMGASLFLTSCDVSNNYASGMTSNNKIYGSTISVITGVNQITTFTNTNFTQNHAKEGTTCAAVFYGEVTASGVSTNLDINGGTFTKNTGATLIYQRGGGFTTLGDYDSKNVTKFTWNTTKKGIYRDSYLSSGDSNRYTMYIDALSFTENYFQFNDVGIRAEGCGDVIIRGSSNNYSSSGAKCEILRSKGNTGSVLYIDSYATLTLGDSNARFMSIYGSIKLTQKSGTLKAYKNFTVNFNNTSTKKIPLYVTSTSVYFPSSAWGSGTTRLVSFLGSGSQLANTNIEIVNTPSYAPKFIYVNGTGYTYNTVDGTYATSSEGDCIAKVVYGASQNYVKRPRTESDFMSNLNTALNNGDTTDVYLYVFSDINITSQITVPREKSLHIYAVKDVTLTKGFATTNSLIALNENAGLTIQTSGAGSLEIDGYQTSYSSSSYVNGHLIWGSTGTTIYMYEGVMLYGNYCTDGGAGSAIYLMSGSVTFRGGKILDCFQKNSNSYGRVIYIGGSTGSFSMYNCTYESFSSMEISAATVTISNSMIHGLGTIVDTGGNTYSLKISDSYFNANNSQGASSNNAIKLDRSSNYTISNCQFVNRCITATTSVTSLTLSNCYFANTTILNINTKFTMQNSKFMFGGKVSITPTSSHTGATITNNEFVRCTPTSGGVLTISGENTSEALTLTNNTFMGCNSPNLIYLSDVSHPTRITASGNKYYGNTFTNSLIELSDDTQKFTKDVFKYNNTTGTDGLINFVGGVNESDITFSGTTFEGNRAVIFNESSNSTLTLTVENESKFLSNRGSIYNNSNSSTNTTDLKFLLNTEIKFNYSTSPLISMTKSERINIQGDDSVSPVSTIISHNIIDSTNTSASIISATSADNYINLEGVVFEGNSARAVYVKGSNPTLYTATGDYGVYFTANYSLFDGGACYIMNTGSTSTTYQWYDVDFTANLARGNGGAIYFDDINGTVNVTTKSWSSCYFGNNASSANGGAIYINSASAVYIDTTTFSMNYATNGGAVYTSAGIVLQTNLEMSHNYASANGGAIYGHYFNKIITVNTKDASLNYNRATNGGAIYLDNQVNGNFQTTTFGYNQVTGNGGAIYKADTSSAGASTTLQVTSGTYTHNQATGNGGAVYVSQVGYTGESNKYLNNSANLGGAIYDYATTMDNNISVNIKRWLASKHETFTSNTAVQGGAIYSQNSIKCCVYGATFDGNSASGNSDDGIKSLGGSIYIDGALEINTGYNATFGAKISNSKADRGSAIYYYNLSSSNYSFNISGLTLSGCGDSYSAIVNAGGNLNLGGEINIPDKKHIIEIAPTDISAQIVLLGKLTNSYNIPYPIIVNETFDQGGFFNNYCFVQANGGGETALINEGTYSGTNAGNQFEYQDETWSLKRGTASDKTSMIYITDEEKAGYLLTNWQSAISSSITLANITSIEFTNVDPSATYSYVGSVGATAIDGGTAYSSVYTSTYSGGIQDVVAYTDTTKTLLKIYCPKNIYFPTSCSKLFQNLTALKEITFNNVDTSHVENFTYFFDKCSALTTINWGKFDTSAAKTAAYMFRGCSSLTSIDTTKLIFNMTSGERGTGDIHSIFQDCSSLKTIDISNWNVVATSRVCFGNLFYGCTNLVSVKLGNLKYVETLSSGMFLNGMFRDCSSLTDIDFGGLKVDLSTVVTATYMFCNASSIKTIDMSSVFTGSTYTTNISNMFNGCTNLESVNFGKLAITPNNPTTTDAFTNCTNLKTIVLPYVTDLVTADNTKASWSITLPTSGKFYYTDTKAIVGTDGTTIGLPASNFSTKSQARTIKVGYTVTANANSGSISATTGWTGTGSTATTFAFWDGKITVFPTVTRTAYSLKKGSNNTGWYTAASAGTELASPFTPTADQTIYAQWTATPYTIKINNNGGSNGSVNNASYTIGTSAQTRTLTNPTRAGYNFASWKVSWTDSTHSSTLPTVSGTTLTIPANCYGNVTLTANWTPINYTLTYNANGGNAVSSKTYTIETDTFALASTSRTGYTFAGWKVTAISGTAYSASGTKIAVGNTITQIYKGSYANITVQAQWTANKQTITFYATSDTASSTQSVDYDATYSMPANPTKSGFTFVGWSEGKDATAEWTSGTQTCKGAKSWYAVWKRSATINYFYINASGARAAGATETVSKNVIYSSTDKNITFTIKAVGNKSFKVNNDTYTFTGFSTDGTSNATGTYAIASDVASKTTTYKTTADTTNMYAVYNSTITLAYNANTGSGAPASQKGVVTKSAGTSAIQTKAVSLTISSTTPTKSGFAFQGWNTSSTATSASHTAGTAYSFDKSTTLYAVWKDATKPVVGTYAWTQNSARNGFDIYANASDNVGVTKVSIPVWTAKNNSTRSDIKWANATKGSYTFNGASYEYKLSVLISDFSNHYGTYQFQVFAYDAANNTTTSTDQNFMNFTWNITYDYASGTKGATNPATYLSKETAQSITLSNPTRIGYTFAGWTSSVSGITVASEKIAIPAETHADVKLTATWSASALTFNNQELNAGTYGTAYTSNAFTGATGGTGSYLYTIKSGAPTDAKIDSAKRTISFTSTTNAGTYSVVVTAKDNGSGVTKDATMTIVINRLKTATASAKTGLVYNGSSQTGVTGSNVSWLGTTSATNAGSYKATATPNANYAWSDGTYTAKEISWTIGKAKLTVTADNKTMTYGGTAPTYSVSYSGFVNGEAASVLGGTLAYTTKNSAGTTVTVNASLAVGTYTIIPSGLTSSNYDITFKNGTLTVQNKSIAGTISITGNVQYGSTLTSTITGGVSGATYSYQWQISADGTTWTNCSSEHGTASTFMITATRTGVDLVVGKYLRVVYTATGNYTGTITSDKTTAVTAGVFNVTVTPSATVTKVYDGTTSVKQTFTLAPANAIGNDASYITLTAGTATYDNANVGTGKTVTIAFTSSGTRAGNYSFTKATTKGAITPATMTYKVNNYSGTYDGNAHGITVSVTTPSGATVKYGTVSGTYDKTASPTRTEAGTTTVYVQITAANYTTVTTTGTITINKATLSTPTASWSTTARGTATWTASTAIKGITISYKVELFKSGSTTAIATQTVSGTSYNFASAIRQSGAGTYTFKVTAISSATANANNSATATSGNLYAVSVSVTAGTGIASATISGVSSYIMINGESATVAYTTKTGYSLASITSSDTARLTMSNTTTATLKDSITTTGAITITVTGYANGYTVTFNGNNGTLTNQTSLNLTYNGSSYNAIAGHVSATRTGYTLTGWFDKATGGNMIWNASGNAVKGTYWTDTVANGGKWQYAGNVTAYAQWTANPYGLTVKAMSNTAKDQSTFANNTVGGTVKIASGTAGATATGNVNFDSTTTITATATSGYKFAGWYTSSDFSGTAVSTSATFTTAKMTTAGQTYYAKFVADTVTVTVSVTNPSHGSIGLDTDNTTNDYGITTNSSTKTTYTFKKTSKVTFKLNLKTGYQVVSFTDNSTSAHFTSGAYVLNNLSGNHELVLTTKPISYTITVYYNGENGLTKLTKSYDYGSTVSVTPTALKGYSTSGWTTTPYTAISQTSRVDIASTNLSVKVTGDATYYQVFNTALSICYYSNWNNSLSGDTTTATTKNIYTSISEDGSAIITGSITMTTNYDVTSTPDGYTFAGWSAYNNGFENNSKTLEVTVGNEQGTYSWIGSYGFFYNVHAVWERTITQTITYNANGHGTAPSNQSASATQFANYTLATKTTPQVTITLASAISATGYIFASWNTSADGKGTDYSAGAKFTANLSESTTTTLYAKWTTDAYTISYDLAGGVLPSGKTNPTSYSVDTASFTLNNPERTGYTFKGWTGSNGTTPQTTVTIAKGTTGNKSYTANWSANTYKVVFNANGGFVNDASYWYQYSYQTKFVSTFDSASQLSTISVLTAPGYWEIIGTPLTVTANTSYTITFDYEMPAFNYLSGYDGLRVQILTQTPSNSNFVNATHVSLKSQGKGTSSITFNSGSNTTVYFVINCGFMEDGHTYSFKIGNLKCAQQSTQQLSTKSVTYDATYGTLPTPTRVGFTFQGWFTDKTAGTRVTNTSKVSITANQTLYARWSANGYTVKFDANEGTLSGKTEIYVAYDGTSYNSVKTHVSANRTGYTFLGWFDSATGGNMIWDASGDGVKGTYWTDIPSKNGKWCYAGNVTAYARWQANVYTITIMPNGGTITVNDQYIKKNADGSVSFTKTYNTTPMNYLSVSGSKDGYTTLGIFDKASGGVKVWGNGGACLNDGTYWKDNTWIYAGDVTLYFQYKDATKPVIERTTYVINSARNGYDVYAYVTDNEAVNRVQFPTWTEKDGQDDLLQPWRTRSEYTGTSGSWTVNGKVYNYKFTALVSAHNNEYGTYNTQIIAYDNAGNERAESIYKINFSWNIAYDLAGGTKGATTPATYLSKEIAQTITLSNPTRTGYTFAGWKSSVSTIIVADEKITIPAETHADVTLTATWKANATNIKYDSNGGTINLFNGNLVDGTFSSYDSKTNTITFNGENKKGQMPQFSYIDLSTTGLMVEGAKFTMTSWGISGSITSSAVQNILYEIASGKGNTLATRNSVPHSITEMLKYVYNPYVNSTTLTATNITDGAIGIYTWIFGGQDETYTNAKFYFQITLVGAESTITIPTAYDANLAYYMPTAVRGGYTFDGWYTAKTGGTKVNPADANSFADGVTLYAHWTANSYNIAVDTVGGSTVTVNNSKYTTSTASQTRTISIAIPTKANYEFNSWQVEWTDGAHSSTLPTVSGQTITIPADCYGSFKLVAKWDEAVASVTFNGTTTYHSTLNKAFTKTNGQVSTASKYSTITILVKNATITTKININSERFVNLTASISTTITRTGKFAMISNYGTFKIYGTDSVSITFQGDTQGDVLLGNNANANLTLGKNVIITGNTTTGNGCAVTSVGTLTVDGASITNNKGGNGAGIMSFKNSSGTGILNIISGSFTGNSATNGGAIYSQGEMTISGGTFDSNTASSSSGAIQNSGKLVITGGTFTNNTANYGGVIGNTTGATLEISGGSFKSNSATDKGGVIQSDGISVTITGGTFDSNSATNNAGVLNNANSKGVVTISNASFINNKATYGGVLYNIGTLTINSGSFTGNSVTKQGGVMRHTGGTLTINDGTFESNSSTGAGAVISMGNAPITYIKGGTFNANTSGSYAGVADCYGTVEVTSGTFTNNSAVNGGGVFSQGAAAGHILTITAGRFESNKVTSGQGGAVLIHQGTIGGTAEFISNTAKSGAGAVMAGQLSVSITGGTFSKNSSNNGGAIKAQTNITISGGTFTENTATTQNGGAIYFNQATVITITGGTFIGNKADNGQGGAIYNSSTNTATITAVFKQNSAKYGGAISNAGSDLTLSGCEITSNTASNNGGAVYSSGTLVVSGGSFTSNTSSASGGAIASTVEATITNVTFDSNSAVSGGALHLNGTATLSGNTFKNNSSTGNGGAVYSIGTTSITGDTFLDNSVASGKDGSGVFVGNGTTTITSATMTTTYASASNIRVEGNGTAIIGGTKSGEVVTIGSKTNRNNYGIRNFGKLTINNAEVYTMRETLNAGSGTTDVNNGTFDSYMNGISATNLTLDGSNAVVNIHGGTFKNGELSDEKRYGNAFNTAFGGVLNIYGGTLQSGFYAYTGNNCTTNIYGGDLSRLVLGFGTGGTINVNADAQIATFNWQGNGGTLNINSDFTLLDCIVFGAYETRATIEDQIINVTTELKNSYNIAIYTSSVADYNAKYINTTTPIVTYASGVTPNANNFAITSTSAVDGGTAKAVKVMTGSTLKANLEIEDYDVQGLYLVGKVTVSFDAVGGTASKSSMEVYYDNAYGELATATKPNYDFAGWYLESTYATVVNSTSIVKSSTDHTLYAKWESAVASVTFGTEVTYYSTLEKAFAYANSLATTSSKNATVTILVDSVTVSSKIVVGADKFINLTASVSTTIARQGNPVILHNYATLNIYGTDSISITFQGDENNQTLIFNETEGSLTLGKNVILTGNKTSVFGGAIYNKGTLTINGASITNNTADCGGAICNVGTITINSGTISGNSSTTHGGAIIIVAGTITIVDGTFSGNSGKNGGFLASSNSPKIFVKGGTFENNTASAYGGVLDISGTAEITGGLFKNNKAYGGGAMSQVEATSSVVTVTGGTFDSNTASIRSGAINIHNGSIGGSAVFTNNIVTDGHAGAVGIGKNNVTITGGTFTGNKAENGQGGAIYHDGKNPATISGAVFKQNTAKNGGAISNANASLTITDCEFTGNTSTENGGAILTKQNLTISGTTFSGNSATGTLGSAIKVESGTTTITSATITNSTVGSAIHVDADATVIIGGTGTNDKVVIGSASNRVVSGFTSYGQLTINNAEVYTSKDVFTIYGGKTTINNGTFNSYTNNTSSTVISTLNATVVINNGTFGIGSSSDANRKGRAFTFRNSTVDIYGGSFETCYDAFVENSSVLNIHAGTIVGNLAINNATINILGNATLSKILFGDRAGIINIGSDFTLTTHIQIGPGSTTANEQIINVNKTLTKTYTLVIYTSSTADYNAKYINTTNAVVTYASGVTPNANNFAITSTSAISGGTAKAVKLMTGSVLRTNLGNNDYSTQGLYLVGKVTVSFNAVGGTASKASMEVYYGNAYGELATATKSGYDFAGWYLESTYATVVNSTSIVKSSTDHTLYAKWEEKFGITVNVNFDSGCDTNTKVVVRIYDLTNKTVRSFIFYNDGSTHKLDLVGFSAGSYMISITTMSRHKAYIGSEREVGHQLAELNGSNTSIVWNVNIEKTTTGGFVGSN